MKFLQWRKVLIALLMSTMLFMTACSAKAPSPYQQVQEETTGRGAEPAVAREATQGSEFNKFFPSSAQGYDIVFTQEKKGFAEAKLKKSGQDMAMLSISDTSSLPQSAAKYQASVEKVAGFPALDIGTTQTGILVGDRYQVKAQSRDPEFTKVDRVAWLQKFDLIGLSKLK